jgi:hypothetical protein
VPIENELKYVLPRDFDAARLSGWDRQDIRQAYLDDGPRIRRIDSDYLFTYKKWVPQAGELVEIETAISHEDFELLWPLCVESLRKTRYVRSIDDAEWVVDFLQDASCETYFVLAEVEMPRFAKAPDSIPPEIRDSIVHSVAADDNGFTNKKLSDPDYARKLYDRIT